MIRFLCGVCLAGSIFVLPAMAKCPVTNGTTVVVRAPLGDLRIDTSGGELAADAQASNTTVQIHQTCNKDRVEFTSNGPDQIGGAPIVWTVVTPRNINLDLVTLGGSITVGDVNGDIVLKTSGGSVTVGQIKGKAAIVTQGGSIKSGNIGGDADLRSQGGTLEVGDIGGNAEFHTNAGRIVAGTVGGDLTAEGGRAITITKAGQVKVHTSAGDISIGDAARINATSGGGHITIRRVRGPFQGHTEEGDIRLDSAGAWVEASTGQGNILVRLIPESYDGDLHMDLQADRGDVTVYLPQRLKATVKSTVQRPLSQIVSEFPETPNRPSNGLIPTNRYYTPTHSESLLNGGGNLITLHTSLGKITIRKN
jgi:hypothetical protein